MSSKKFLIIAALVIVIVLIGANWTQVKAALPKLSGGTAGTDTSGAAGSAATKTATTTGKAVKVGNDYSKVLSKGVASPEVTELQTLLNKVNSARKGIVYNLVVDGKFGALTETMLKYYAGVTSITLKQAYAKVQAAYGM